MAYGSRSAGPDPYPSLAPGANFPAHASAWTMRRPAMPPPRTLVLVQAPGQLAEFELLAEQLPWVPARGLGFAALQGEPQRAVAEHRMREGAVAIGVVVDSEPDALLALSGGAD